MKKNVIDINQSNLKKFVESLRPKEPEIREQLDFGYSYDGKTIEIYEIRPVWNNPSEIQHLPFAKIRYYRPKIKEYWKLYWMRGNLKWKLYDPHPSSTDLIELLEVIKEDKFACFFG